MDEIVIRKGPTCAGCGEGEERDGAALFMWDELNKRGEWWHLKCVPPSLRLQLEARGWQFEGAPWE
jgi:hypothetical protein